MKRKLGTVTTSAAQRDPRIVDPECVYAERVFDIPTRAGAHAYFLHWWGWNPSLGRWSWRGQIFNSETKPADAARALAWSFGRAWCVLGIFTLPASVTRAVREWYSAVDARGREARGLEELVHIAYRFRGAIVPPMRVKEE